MKEMYMVVVSMAVVAMVTADIYLHNPRGSNNRQDENSRHRRNAKRLFDSQNNNRGGYNKGEPMNYYVDSKLSIEWTNQHQCNGPNANCDIIIQWMCSPSVRDGETTKTIPEYNYQCKNNNCDTDERFGMHESNKYYHLCRHSRYNTLLFTADQNLTKNSARFTRQNPNGQRRGYECPEERDYYPYWRPSPWMDIVILTSDKTKCDDYKSKSENKQGRSYCHHEKLYEKIFSNTREQRKAYKRIPITQVECERFEDKGVYGEWRKAPSHDIPSPECVEVPRSRDNHLGNGPNAQPNTFVWTIPNKPCDNAVLRIRYNISTNDYGEEVNFDSNGRPAKLINIGDLVGLSNEEAHKRGYVFKTNPEVQPFGGEHGRKLKLALAMNTAQYGRVFQDRSHKFKIKANPPIADCGEIHNLNVRGKRGNIVQVYPAVEYDFVPNTLKTKVGDCIHFQWTGSDNNPRNNAGEGTKGTDRSNVVLLEGRADYVTESYQENGHLSRNYPMHLDNVTFLGLDTSDLKLLAILEDKKDVQAQLNNVPAYFDLGLRKIKRNGIFNYMCTRNNNFSNRSQKGKIIVENNVEDVNYESDNDAYNKRDSSTRKYHEQNEDPQIAK